MATTIKILLLNLFWHRNFRTLFWWR